MDQTQRRDIDTTLDDRLTLAIDEENIADNPYIFEPSSFVGNNWFKQGSNIVKLNLAEQDSLIFLSSPLVKLLQKDITNVIVSFDYQVSNVSVNYPILSNISLTCMEMTNYMLVENILTTQGHIDVDCSLFNFSSNVVNTSISEQGFKVGINFNGNKSNATIKLSNVQIQFKYQNKLSTQEDSVVNRLEPHIDFYRDEDGDLVLQIGGDASGKGMDHSGGDIDTYSKTEIDNKLATKVNIEVGKGLSSNDYTLTEKTKLGTIETNANYYVHPSSHQTGMIVESSALTNLETSENATQHEINLAIDSKINSGGGSVDWSDIENKPSDYPPSSHNHDDRYYTESEIDTALNGKADVNSLSTVATTGDYDDLIDKPIIPSKTSDLNNDNGFITSSSLPTKVSDLQNDTGFITSSALPTKTSDLTNDGDGTNAFLTQHQSLANYVQKSSTSGLLKNDGSVDTTQYLSSLPSHNHDDRYYTETEIDTALSGKQATLVSGTNIKTINNTSLLGSGNISIQGGGSVTVDSALSTTSENPVQNKVITGALNGKADSSSLSTVATSGSYNDLSNKPSIPSKTSDLTNDGDGSNVFVKDNDSRLSNARTPLAHTHLSSDVTDLIDVIYPVGSIYMSVNSVNPSTLFGGTWEQIKDTFLLSSGDTYSNGATGGSATVSLSASQMPRHNHSTNAHSHSTNDNGEYFVTNTQSTANNTRVTYSSSGNRMVDGFNTTSSIFHHRADTDSQSPSTKYTGGTASTEAYQNGSAHENMPPYLVVNIWKRTA